MSFLHKHSNVCVKSELDLFAVPPTQTSVESATIVQSNPITLNVDGPLKFNIPAVEGLYQDLSQTYLYTKVKITKANDALTEDSVVAPSNLFLHTMFSQVDVYLRNSKITSSVNTYPYRCLFETLLNYGSDAKDTHLTTSLFYKDTPGNLDSVAIK